MNLIILKKKDFFEFISMTECLEKIEENVFFSQYIIEFYPLSF